MCICTFFVVWVQTKTNMVSVAKQCTLVNRCDPLEPTPDVHCKIESEIKEGQKDDGYVVEYGSSSEEKLDAMQPTDN